MRNPRRAFGLKPEDFDPHSLAQGTEIELEHTDDPKEAQRIAMDHLEEDPWYYSKLTIVESSLFVPAMIIGIGLLIWSLQPKIMSYLKKEA